MCLILAYFFSTCIAASNAVTRIPESAKDLKDPLRQWLVQRPDARLNFAMVCAYVCFFCARVYAAAVARQRPETHTYSHKNLRACNTSTHTMTKSSAAHTFICTYKASAAYKHTNTHLCTYHGKIQVDCLHARIFVCVWYAYDVRCGSGLCNWP